MKKFGRKFYVNEETGQYDCKRCDASGNTITFARYFNEDPGLYCDQLPIPTKIDLEKVEQYHKNLIARPELWRKPWKHHILELLQVGWDDLRQSLVFPIHNFSGQIINLIHHKTFQNKGARCTLYPAHILKDYDPTYIVICEGLVDCISLLSIDIQVVTATAGALSIPADISVLRRFNRIYVCFDVEEAGEAGCDRWINRLLSEMER
ncbi:MAG: toprim domain-containing protein [Candidatus Marinimicrobia bacterium]|nr:toprim domain-containing protein [Candidatus Neomarinimicrobiota bacterium]